MFEHNINQSWLYYTPSSDENFKAALRRAKVKELQEVLAALPEVGNKTKIAAIQREIRKRKRKCQTKK